MVAHTCDPSFMRGAGRRIAVHSWPGQKHKTLSKKITKKQKTKPKKIWGCGSSDTAFSCTRL
jgi:hypothetical protein